jgi:hypothetical protein
MRPAQWPVWCLAGLWLALVGCGNNLYPVKGRVHFADGSPLPVGRVVIDSGSATTGSWGLVQPDGTFQIGTHTTNDGVPAGTHRVYIENATTYPPPGHSGPFTPKPLIHPRFTNPKRSGLTFEVPRQTDWDIVVERPGP